MLSLPAPIIMLENSVALMKKENADILEWTHLTRSLWTTVSRRQIVRKRA
jgi:hypothetical protein